MSGPDSLFDYVDGDAYFRGLRVEQRTIEVAGHSFTIVGLEDAADLLDQDDFARRFLEDDVAPYGLELWPAARMLVEHCLRSEDGKGRSAVELGCGLGLVSIAASMKGWRTLATDNEQTSLRFAEYNARLNGADIAAFATLDWHDPPRGRKFERIFAADVLYQLADHVPVLACVRALLASNGIAFIADPNRGVVDRFASLAKAHGFRIHTATAAAPNARGKTVSGRIFELRPRRA